VLKEGKNLQKIKYKFPLEQTMKALRGVDI
jgi:hypothetical protein